MNGRCLFLVIVSLCSVLLDFASAGYLWTSKNFCFWSSSLSNGQTQYMFLYQTTVGTQRSLVLFESTWNKENSLVDCTTSNKRSVIKSFLSKCSKDRDGLFSDIPDQRIDISMLIEPDGPCVDSGSLPELRMPVRRTRDLETMDRKSSQKLNRSKRAWMIPGTLWCGSGNKASQFSDLGLFVETDECCREHDHCEQTIASFEFDYGIFNTNFFTLSHCDCDSKFRNCLQNVNNRVSDMVGYSYFNLLKMRCFEFSQRMECAERTWWGKCIHREMTTYALLRDATNYTSTFPVLEDENLHLTTHHTFSFRNLTAINDWVMSTDIVTEDASKTHLSVSVSQRLSVIDKTSHKQTTESLNTHRTDSPRTESTDSPNLESTDSRNTESTDSPNTESTDSPNTESTDSPKPEPTDSPKPEPTDSLNPESTDSPNPEPTSSPNPESTGSPNPESTDSSIAKTTCIPHVITNSPTTQTVSARKQTDGPKSEATDSSQTISLIKQTDVLTETIDSTKKQITASLMAQTKGSAQTKPTDSSIILTTDPPNPETTHLTEVHIHPEMQTKQKGKLDICENYKDLDSCPYQIPALQEKFGLRNYKRTTLYHCNCTDRLARELAGDEVDEIHFWMLDFVSQFCFFLPQNCTESESCSTSFSNDTPIIERWSTEAAVWRHLVAQKRKARRFDSKRSRRKNSPIRMHKKCLRMHSKLHQPKNTEGERSAATVQ